MKYDLEHRRIWFKGEVIPVDEARINPLAPTAQFGLNVFEGIPGYWNEDEKQLYAFRLQDHFDRLIRSAERIQIECPFSRDELTDAFMSAVKANEFEENISVRQTLFVDGFGSWGSEGPVNMFVAPIPRGYTNPEYNKKALRVCISSWQRISEKAMSPRTKCGANYINSRNGQREALKKGFDTCVFLNEFGRVSEGPGSCFFIVKGNQLITPALTESVLESITRDTVMKIGRKLGIESIERPIEAEELQTAEEAFLCGSAMEITPISAIDDREIPDSRMTKEIYRIYVEAAKGRIAEFRDWVTPVG